MKNSPAIGQSVVMFKQASALEEGSIETFETFLINKLEIKTAAPLIYTPPRQRQTASVPAKLHAIWCLLRVALPEIFYGEKPDDSKYPSSTQVSLCCPYGAQVVFIYGQRIVFHHYEIGDFPLLQASQELFFAHNVS